MYTKCKSILKVTLQSQNLTERPIRYEISCDVSLLARGWGGRQAAGLAADNQYLLYVRITLPHPLSQNLPYTTRLFGSSATAPYRNKLLIKVIR